MSELTKLRFIPVKASCEIEWLKGKLLSELSPAVIPINALGKRYEHDTKWDTFCLNEPTAFLNRVRIGAIGRINTVEDAIDLGIKTKAYAFTHHFTSTGLYYIYRYARQQYRQMVYLKKLEKWTESYSKNNHNPSMFLNYSNKEFCNENA